MVRNALRALAARNARLNGRLTRLGDDEGSLMLALLLVFLGTSLAALMTPVLLIAINGTRTDQARVAAVGRGRGRHRCRYGPDPGGQ